MEIRKYSYFWEAFIIAIFIFAVGLFLGYMLELNRTSKIISVYQQSELDNLDMKVLDNILSVSNLNCENFFSALLNFANRIYDESLVLERYEGANQLSEGIMLQHKKYDILRTILWVDALRLKEKCNMSFNILVYLYEYNSPDMDVKFRQEAFAKKLSEIKQNKGSNILLLPLAGNLNISSIELLKKNKNITTLPTILLNEKIKIESIAEVNLLDSYLN